MDEYQKLREQMVRNQLEARDITDQKVLAAFRQVPREKFISKNVRAQAYEDYPLSIGEGQTISQPYIVAKMCQLLELTGSEKVLDIGTGSGFQAAILSQLAKTVIAVEMIKSLALKAKDSLKDLGYENVIVINQDGRQGVDSEAPFDAIKSAAASEEVPRAWKEQLKVGGKIVLPLQSNYGQILARIKKTKTGFKKQHFSAVKFVPLV